jgi:hypothetical protein
LKHEGTTGFPLYKRDGVGRAISKMVRQEDKDSYRGLFEVVTVYYKAVNDDSIPGIYYFPYNHAVESRRMTGGCWSIQAWAISVRLFRA